MKRFALVLFAVLAVSLGCFADGLFANVQKGPLTGAPKHSAPVLGIDTSCNILYYGIPGTNWLSDGAALNVQGAQTALTTVTTAQTMFTYTPAAGCMNVAGRTIQICGEAMFSNASTTPTITVSLVIGSTTVASLTGAANANSNSNSPLQYCFTVSTAATGASGTDEAHGWLMNAVSAAWSSGTAMAVYVDGNTAVSSTYDHTAANAIAVQIAATAALTSVTPRQQTIMLLQ